VTQGRMSIWTLVQLVPANESGDVRSENRSVGNGRIIREEEISLASVWNFGFLLSVASLNVTSFVKSPLLSPGRPSHPFRKLPFLSLSPPFSPPPP
jgi:hypothetical protein